MEDYAHPLPVLAMSEGPFHRHPEGGEADSVSRLQRFPNRALRPRHSPSSRCGRFGRIPDAPERPGGSLSRGGPCAAGPCRGGCPDLLLPTVSGARHRGARPAPVALLPCFVETIYLWAARSMRLWVSTRRWHSRSREASERPPRELPSRRLCRLNADSACHLCP